MENCERLSDNERNEKLNDFLRDMARLDTNVETCHENYVRILSKIYLDQDGNQIYRHNYSSITRFMYKEWDTTEAYTIALENMRLLENRIDSESALNECLRKLYDHVDLECLHMGRMGTPQTMQEMVTSFTTQISEKTKSLNTEVEKIRKGLDDSNVQIVSVLGIFAGVVFAFSGGFSMLGSVFNNLSAVNGAQALLFVSVVLFAGAILFDVLYLLLCFIACYFLKNDTVITRIGGWAKVWNWVVLGLAVLLLAGYLACSFYHNANEDSIQTQNATQIEVSNSSTTPSDG